MPTKATGTIFDVRCAPQTDGARSATVTSRKNTVIDGSCRMNCDTVVKHTWDEPHVDRNQTNDSGPSEHNSVVYTSKMAISTM